MCLSAAGGRCCGGEGAGRGGWLLFRLGSFHHSRVRTEMSFGMEQDGEVIFSAKPAHKKKLTLGCMCQGTPTGITHSR